MLKVSYVRRSTHLSANNDSFKVLPRRNITPRFSVALRGPVVFKVVPVTGATLQATTDQLMCAPFFPHPLLVWSGLRIFPAARVSNRQERESFHTQSMYYLGEKRGREKKRRSEQCRENLTSFFHKVVVVVVVPHIQRVLVANPKKL